MPRDRVRRRADGSFELHLPDAERQLLGALVAELRDLLVADDRESTRRLFPPAYANDEEREEEYRLLAHDELLQARLTAIDTVEATIGAEVLDADQLQAWMGVINDIRLVLGTRLEITEDMDDVEPGDPRAAGVLVYGVLTHLLGNLIHAIADW